jgi:glycosyltransferase involved in cell wall biosynthesis
LLPKCIDSILSQTYRELEIIVMDDCSPDNTGEVVARYDDKRIRHVRNDPNIGHLKNYNKGIGLSRGKYVWLISADDYLRDSRVLERYVGLLERNPRVGYTCCSGIGVVNGEETGLIPYSKCYKSDRVVDGHAFLRILLRGNVVLAASGLARRECYEKLGMFPLSEGMAWTGDWYLWCLFALFYEVGFFADPMVCYREHALSMTTTLKDQNSPALALGDIAVPWMIKSRADEAGLHEVSQFCLEAIAYVYVRVITRAEHNVSRRQFEKSLFRYGATGSERAWLRARVYSGMADSYYWQGYLKAAKRFYLASRSARPWRLNVLVKLLLLSLGRSGHLGRRGWRAAVEHAL